MAESGPQGYTGFTGKEEMEASLEKLKKDVEKLKEDLKQTVREKDQALKLLNHLMQKRDKDKKIIKGHRDEIEKLRGHIGQLNTNLIHIGLQKDVAYLRCTIESKDAEISKIQTALGSAENEVKYAEKELKERLERELASVRDENKQLKNSIKKGNPKPGFTCVWPYFSFHCGPASVTSPVDIPIAAAAKPPVADVAAAKPPVAVVSAVKSPDVYWDTAAGCSDPRGDAVPNWDEFFPKHDPGSFCSIM